MIRVLALFSEGFTELSEDEELSFLDFDFDVCGAFTYNYTAFGKSFLKRLSLEMRQGMTLLWRRNLVNVTSRLPASGLN